MSGSAPASDDAFGKYVGVLHGRRVEDPHLWTTALFDEVTALGYDLTAATAYLDHRLK
jgi:hypothetical protein